MARYPAARHLAVQVRPKQTGLGSRRPSRARRCANRPPQPRPWRGSAPATARCHAVRHAAWHVVSCGFCCSSSVVTRPVAHHSACSAPARRRRCASPPPRDVCSRWSRAQQYPPRRGSPPLRTNPTDGGTALLRLGHRTYLGWVLTVLRVLGVLLARPSTSRPTAHGCGRYSHPSAVCCYQRLAAGAGLHSGRARGTSSHLPSASAARCSASACDAYVRTVIRVRVCVRAGGRVCVRACVRVCQCVRARACTRGRCAGARRWRAVRRAHCVGPPALPARRQPLLQSLRQRRAPRSLMTRAHVRTRMTVRT